MKKFIFSFLMLVLVLCLSVVIITDKKEVSAYNGSAGNPPSSGNYFVLNEDYLITNIDKDLLDPIYISYVEYNGSRIYSIYNSNYNFAPSGYTLVKAVFRKKISSSYYEYSFSSGVRVDYTYGTPANNFYWNCDVVLEYSALPTYTITFNANGGIDIRTPVGIQSTPYSFSVSQGSTVVLDDYFSFRTGYNFLGWDKTQAELTNIQSNITVNAVWQPITYTVTFNLNGGTRTGGGDLVQTVNYGSSATAPLVTRTGYTFLGWDKSFDNITSDLTVNAQWQINTYTVTFNLNGGTRTGGGELVQTVNYGSSAIAPIVTRTGYTFIGWDKSFNYITSDLTVNALWSINYYTITFDIQGGSYSGSVPLTQTVIFGGSATVPDYHDITKENYFFWGWLNLDKASNVTQDAVISVNWNNPNFLLDIQFSSTSGTSIYFDNLDPLHNDYNMIYGARDIPTVVNSFIYNQGFFYNGTPQSMSWGQFVVNGNLDRFDKWNIIIKNYGTDSPLFSFTSTDLQFFNYENWQSNLNLDWYAMAIENPNDFDLNSTLVINANMVVVENWYIVTFQDYITSLTYNPDGSINQYLTTTTIERVRGGQHISSLAPRPLDFPGKFFGGWLDTSTNELIDIYDMSILKDYVVTPLYVDRLFNVTFWYQFNKLGVYSFRGGFGTIEPPNFSFPVGQTLVGWSNELNGAVIDLSNYPLSSDTDLYAITNFNNLNPDSNFEIPYQDCSAVDIPCHLGNAVVYFLNEFPLISDIVHLVVPIGTLFTLFTQYFVVFETLGILYTLSLGILFVYFIFRLFK